MGYDLSKKEDCYRFVRDNMPIGIKPLRSDAKRAIQSPFKSGHAHNTVVDYLSKKLYEELKGFAMVKNNSREIGVFSNLHLNLIGKWYNMILVGEKKEEYRKISGYWCSKLLLYNGEHYKADWWQKVLGSNGDHFVLTTLIREGVINYKYIDKIIFSNGYAKERPQCKSELESISIGTGREDWGAEKGVMYFVLKLK